jgi:hypothetical protein
MAYEMPELPQEFVVCPNVLPVLPDYLLRRAATNLYQGVGLVFHRGERLLHAGNALSFG